MATFDVKKWANSALQVQDACNLSGVVASFARMTHEMRESGMGTSECNQHPLTRLFVDKLLSLAGPATMRDYEYAQHGGKYAPWQQTLSDMIKDAHE